ncbi:acyltransferase family protein [Variovorax sp. LT1P1]|uniref:acyltransferase family protein n=1 Tax=Variovorax sp. LT1P1 TaxID=3443730 RepID=UPI003F448DDC
MTRKTGRFAYLDIGRVLACVLVVLYHAGGTASLPKYFGSHELEEIVALGYVRMPFFFAMSGFLLSWIYLRSDSGVSAVTFVAKRLARLFPLYWIVLCAVAAMQIFVSRQPDAVPTGWGWWATFFLLPQDPSAVGGTGAPVIYPAWVLQYELVAYLLLAAALSSPLLRRAYLFGFPLLYFFLNDSSIFLLSFIGSKWLLIFWCGAFAAWMANSLEEKHFRWALGGALAWLAWTGLVQYSASSGAMSGNLDIDLLYGVGFALLMLGLARRQAATSVGGVASIGRRGMEKVALWSYAIFLCHAPVISLVCKVLVAAGFTGSTGWELAVGGSLLLSIAAGAVAHWTVEGPIDRAIQRMTDDLRERYRAWASSRAMGHRVTIRARGNGDGPPRR